MTDDEINSSFDQLRDDIRAIDEKLAVREETERELLEMYTNIKGFMLVMSWVEYCSVWIAKMSVAAGILWFLFRESVKEALKKTGE